jgi:hypothetical protein
LISALTTAVTSAGALSESPPCIWASPRRGWGAGIHSQSPQSLEIGFVGIFYARPKLDLDKTVRGTLSVLSVGRPRPGYGQYLACRAPGGAPRETVESSPPFTPPSPASKAKGRYPNLAKVYGRGWDNGRPGLLGGRPKMRPGRVGLAWA